MGSFAFVALFIVGAMILFAMWLWIYQRENETPAVKGGVRDLLPEMPVTAGENPSAALVATPHGQVLHISGGLRRWLELEEHQLPDLERIARQVQPVDNFLALFTGEMRASFQIRERWVEASSHYVPAGDQVRVMVVMRELASGASAGNDVMDVSRVMGVIDEIGDTINAGVGVEPALQLILEALKRVLPSDAGEICLWDEKAKFLHQRGWIGDTAYLLIIAEAGGGYKSGQGVAGWVAAHRRPIMITGRDDVISVEDMLKNNPYYSAVALPLTLGDRFMGTVALFSREPNAYDSGAVALLQAVSKALATAINNAELYARQEDRIKDIASLQQIAEQPKDDQGSAQIFALLNERMAKLLDAEMCGVFLYDKDREALLPQLPFFGMLDQIAIRFVISLPARSPQRDIWENQPYWVSNDLTDEPLVEALGFQNIVDTVGIKNTALIPLQIGGERIGFVAVSNRRAAAGFTPTDMQSLRVLATQAAIVVENVRLYQRERLIDTELLGLQEMTHAIGALSHEGEFYSEISERIARLTGTEMCGILLHDRRRQALVAQLPFYGIDRMLVEHYYIHLPPGSVMDELWTDDDTWYSNRVDSDTLVYEAGLDGLAAAAGVNKTLMAVMAAGGRRIGVVQISNKIDGSDFTDKDARLLLIFATQAAAIVENARLYREVKVRADQADSLRKVAELSSAVLTTQQTFQPVLAEISKFMNSPIVFINVIDHTTHSLTTYPRWVYGFQLSEPIIQDISAPGYEGTPALSGRTFLSNDVLNDKFVLGGYRNLARRFNITTSIIVPLSVGDRMLGELGVANRSDRAYAPEDVSALGTVAAQITAALERLLQYEATGENLRRRMEELDAIARISNELTLTIELDHILNVIREEAGKATHADDSTVILLHPVADWREADKPEMQRRLGGTPSMADKLAEIEIEAIMRGTDPVSVANYAENELKPQPAFARSAVAAAILYSDQVVGVVHVYHKEPGHFSDRVAGFMMTLSAKASLGYQNYFYYRQQLDRGTRLRQRVEQLNRIFELGQMLQSTTDADSVLEAIAYSVQTSVGYDTVLMLIQDENTRTLYRVAHAGLPLDVFNSTRHHSITLDKLNEFLKSEFNTSESYFFPIERAKEWVLDGIQALSTSFQDSRTMSGSGKEGWRDGDMLVVKMMGQGGNLLGVMVLDRPYTNLRPDRSTIEVLEIFAHQASTMVENTRLFAESQRSAALEARLNEMLNAIASTLELPDIGRAIAKGMKDLIPFNRLTIALTATEDRTGYDYLKIGLRKDNSLDVSQEVRQTLERTALGRTLDDQKEYLYASSDTAVRHYEDLKAWHTQGEASSLILPLIAGGECLGVIHVGSRIPDTFSKPEIHNMLLRITQLVSSTIQNARLFNQAVNLQILNRSVVESIQQGIVVLDKSGHIINVNAYMRDAYGWDDSARLQDLFAYRPEMSEMIKDDLRMVLEEGTPGERFGQTSPAADGTLLVRNFYIYPLRYNEQVRGAVLLVEDVTERTKLEQAMEARANQLAALTDVSTRITASLERSEVMSLALDEMGWIIPFDVMLIWRRNGSFMVLEGQTGLDVPSSEVRVKIADDERIQQLVESQRVVSLTGDVLLPIIRGIGEDEFHSWMGVPLVNQGHVVGMLVLAKAETGHYESRQEQNVAFAFASQVAIALANADLFEQTFERTNELGTLLDAAQATSLTRDVTEVFNTVATHMFSALDMETCAIMIWDEVDNELVVEFAVNRSGDSELKNKRYNLMDYPARQRALKQREVVVIADPDLSKSAGGNSDVPAYMSEVHELRELGYGARMLVPLVVGDQSIGLIQLEQTSGQEESLTQQKVRLARTLGAQLAVAIENARLSAETTNRFEELLTINALSQAISSTLSLADMLPVIREQLPSLTGAEEMYIALFNPDEKMITFPLAVRSGEDFLIPSRPVANDEVSYIIKRKHTLSLGADYFSPDDLRRSMGITNGEGDVKSYMGVPLKSGDQVMGVLAIRNRERSRAFSLNDDRVLTTVGSQLGAAIQNARLFEKTSSFADELNRLVLVRTEELEQERDRLDTLYQITAELARTLDMEQLLDRALGMVSKAVGAQDGVIMLSDPATDRLFCRAWLNPNHLRYEEGEETPTHPAEGLATWLIHNSDTHDHVTVVDDLNQEAYWNIETDGQTGLRSALAVILESNEDPMGVMVLLSETPHAFSENHLKLLVPAANQVAASINSADLYQLIRDQAERLGKLLRGEQEEAQKHGAILEAIADGVMLADASGKIVLFNTAAERILQLPRDQAIGQPVTRLAGLYGASALRWMQILEEWQESLRSEEARDASVSEQIELGDKIISTQLAPVYIGDSFLGTVSVFRDITRDIEADRAKNKFIERVSHEFRTPLTPIKGYTDLLLMGAGGDLSDMQENFLTTIKDNIDRLTVLVNDVLNIAKIQNRNLLLTMQMVDLQEIVPEVVDALAARAVNRDKNLIIKVGIQPDLPSVRADRERLIQIINNVTDNAFKYTLPGGTIDVSAELEENGTFVLVTIADTGVGIPESFKELAWQRFQRYEDHALQLDVAGTGLGLPLVKELVELHHGKTWFESEAGKGTTFYIRLPLEQPNYVTESMGAVPVITPLNQIDTETVAGD